MLRLFWAKTPAQYAEMYKEDGPSSCMTLDPENTEAWTSMQKGDSPVAFYAYVPGVVGAYLKDTKTGEVKARAIVHTSFIDGKRYYTGIYSDDGSYYAMEYRLNRRGIEQSGRFNVVGEFEIPARTLGGNPDLRYFPVPSIDFCYANKSYRYVKSRDVFKVRLGLPKVKKSTDFYTGCHGYVSHRP